MSDKAGKIRELESSLSQTDNRTGRRLLEVNLQNESLGIPDLISWDLSNMKLRRKDTLKIVIRSHGLTKQRRKDISDEVLSYYSRQFIDQRRKLTSNAVKALSMLATGVALLFLRMILIRIFGDFLLSESILVSSWVFTWEAIALVCFERPELLALQKQNTTVLESELAFEEE